MVGMWAFTAMDLGLIPGWGANIPQATWCGKKKKKTTTLYDSVRADICRYKFVQTYRMSNSKSKLQY